MGSQEHHELKFLGKAAHIEACSYEYVFIIFSVDVYPTKVFRNVYRLLSGQDGKVCY